MLISQANARMSRAKPDLQSAQAEVEAARAEVLAARAEAASATRRLAEARELHELEGEEAALARQEDDERRQEHHRKVHKGRTNIHLHTCVRKHTISLHITGADNPGKQASLGGKGAARAHRALGLGAIVDAAARSSGMGAGQQCVCRDLATSVLATCSLIAHNFARAQVHLPTRRRRVWPPRRVHSKWAGS